MPNKIEEGGQALIKCLEREGVEYIFGYSGGAAIPIFDALVTTENSIEFVLVRHEQGAVHMADGYARATGKAGGCSGDEWSGGNEYVDWDYDGSYGFGSDDRCIRSGGFMDAGKRCVSGSGYIRHYHASS